MRALLIIIVVAVVGFFVYTKMDKTPPAKSPTGTPKQLASSFVKAALEHDMNKVSSYCSDQAATLAERVAEKIYEVNPAISEFSWRVAGAESPNEALTAMFGPQRSMLTIEMAPLDGGWQIVTIGIADM